MKKYFTNINKTQEQAQAAAVKREYNTIWVPLAMAGGVILGYLAGWHDHKHFGAK